LKLATSIWYTTWAWGVAYQETTLRTKIDRGPGYRGPSKKIWDLLFISATIEASNFKFGIRLGLGDVACGETTFTMKIGRGAG